jgi:hypothetical protein
MPKKLFAVTNVKTSLPGQEATFFAANSEIDPSKFTKEQLVELHEAGAVEVRVVEDEETKVTEPEEPTTPAEETPAEETPTTETPDESEASADENPEGSN